MVSPIYLIAIALGAAFLLPLIHRYNKRVTDIFFFAVLAASTGISAQWLFGFVFQDLKTVQIITAGVQPPLSINLQMGFTESVLLTGINFLGLMGAIYLFQTLKTAGIRAQVLFMVFTMGLNGLILTRDLFNLFVFLEIISIASYSLIALELNGSALRSGLRYMVAGSIASVLLLLGIILLYGVTGTLNIDGMTAQQSNLTGVIASMAVFMLFFALLIEMKQFPANGWALDVYQSAHPGISAMLSAGSSGAILFALVKVLPLAGASWHQIIAVVGLVTFVLSNLMGVKQRNTTRMLGYSSIGQMGLLLMVIGLVFYLNGTLAGSFWMIGALFFNHFFAKAGLYWLAGLVNQEKISDWSIIQSKSGFKFLMALFIFSLLALPPFAGFWGKWSLILMMAKSHLFVWMALLLIGSLLEGVYLLHWLGMALRGAEDVTVPAPKRQQTALWIFGAMTLAAGWTSSLPFDLPLWMYVPVAATLVLYFLDWLPAKLKGLLVIGVLTGFTIWLLPGLTGTSRFFSLFFAGSGSVMTITTLNRKGKAAGFYPMLVLMLLSLSALTATTSLLQFFLFWELMTLPSYMLILKRRNAQKAAFQYILFSLGGAYLILAAFSLIASNGSTSISLDAIMQPNIWIFTLLALGFLVKVAAIGLHIWAPGAYTEADDDVTPMLSGILSKAGIFGLLLPLSIKGLSTMSIPLTTILGWAGALTAFFATLYAVFQEDIKKLLAFSSIGQVGYIVLGLAAMSHLGWAAAFYHTVNHLLFKGLLFTAIAGVIYRTGTRNMYEMGGLIKKMPLSFISVLMGIIALSGVPPLTGFGGKWLLYEALIERGWYLQTGLSFFASTIAFLYCYRLIHTIFLGMPKPMHKDVKEAPVWFIVPQFILIGAIMLLSINPGLLLKPISQIIAPIFSTTLEWQGSTAISSLGYWNATFLMIMVGAIFVSVTLYLLFISPRPRKVGAFNIVFAAERPERPETTHYAYDFFSAYRRAMAPVLKPLVRNFWSGVSEWTTTSAAILRQIYSGNMQTYILFIFIFGLILYFFSVGVS